MIYVKPLANQIIREDPNNPGKYRLEKYNIFRTQGFISGVVQANDIDQAKRMFLLKGLVKVNGWVAMDKEQASIPQTMQEAFEKLKSLSKSWR